MDTQDNSSKSDKEKKTDLEVSQLRSFKKDSDAIKQGKDYRLTDTSKAFVSHTSKGGDLGALVEVEQKPVVLHAENKPEIKLSTKKIDAGLPQIPVGTHIEQKINLTPNINVSEGQSSQVNFPAKLKVSEVEKKSEISKVTETRNNELNSFENVTSAGISTISKATMYVENELMREAKKLEDLEKEEATLEEKNKIEEQEIALLKTENETLKEEMEMEGEILKKLKREKIVFMEEKESEERESSVVEHELKRIKIEKKHQEEELQSIRESQINLTEQKQKIDEEKRRQAVILQELDIVKDDLAKAGEYLNRAKRDIIFNKSEGGDLGELAPEVAATPDKEKTPVTGEVSSTLSIEKEVEEIERIKLEIIERKKLQQQELAELRKQKSDAGIPVGTPKIPIQRNTSPEFQTRIKKEYSADPYREPLNE